MCVCGGVGVCVCGEGEWGQRSVCVGGVVCQGEL